MGAVRACEAMTRILVGFLTGFLAFPVALLGSYVLTLWQTRKEWYR